MALDEIPIRRVSDIGPIPAANLWSRLTGITPGRSRLRALTMLPSARWNCTSESYDGVLNASTRRREEDKGKHGVAVEGSWYLSKMSAMQLSTGTEVDVNNATWTRGQVAVT